MNVFSGVASAQLQVFDLAACAGEGALPRLLMHRLSQRDPKRPKEIQRAQERRGLPRAEGQHKARKARNIIKEASRRA